MADAEAPFDRAALDFYAKEAAAYAARLQNPARHLQAFLDRLPPGASILELGCGGGRDTAAMLARGFDVDATDGVAEIAREAKRLTGRSVRVMMYHELEADGVYDAVWAHASLLHVPREALPDILGRICRALKPGGFHYANFKAGLEGGRDKFGRYYNYPSRQFLTSAYAAAGDWEIAELGEYESGGYDGKTGPWLAITLLKRA